MFIDPIHRSLNDSNVHASEMDEDDDEEISPRKPPKKDFFKSFLTNNQEKGEAELYLDNQSKGINQFDDFPIIIRIYK